MKITILVILLLAPFTLLGNPFSSKLAEEKINPNHAEAGYKVGIQYFEENWQDLVANPINRNASFSCFSNFL